MKKLIICFFVLGTLSIQTKAQGGKAVEYYQVLDSAVKDETGQLRLEHVLRNEFSRIIKTNTSGTVGNYVGLSTKDDNLSFAYSFIKKENVFQITGGGKVNNGVTNLVSDSKLNGGVSLGVNYYRMFGQKNISIVFDEVKSLQKNDRELTQAYELYNLTNHKRTDSTAVVKKKAEIEKLEAERKKLQKIKDQLLAGGGKTYIDSTQHVELHYKKRLTELEVADLKLDITRVKDSVDRAIRRLQQTRDSNPNREVPHQRFLLDSLKSLKPLYALIQLQKAKADTIKSIHELIQANTFNEQLIIKVKKKLEIARHELKVAEYKFDYVSNGWEWNETYNAYIHNQRKNLEKLQDVQAKSIDLKWIGFGFSLENTSFKLLDSINSIASEKDLIPAFNISLTRYVNKLLPAGSKGRHISYTTLAAKLRFGNNLSTLKELTVEQSDPLTANTVSTSSQKAYTGTFDDQIISGQLSLDHYRFVGTKENYGFHIRAQTDLLESQTVTSLRLGVLFAALKPEDQNSIINFELFYGLNDLLKEGGEDSLFSRNVIGIQTTIPFNFNL